MNSRLGHIRPILREFSNRSSATDTVRLYSSVIQMTAAFKLVLVYKENCIKNKYSWLGLRRTDLTAATAKKVAEKLEKRSSADLDLPKTLSATTNRVL
jgi:hypothetical protein